MTMRGDVLALWLLLLLWMSFVRKITMSKMMWIGRQWTSPFISFAAQQPNVHTKNRTKLKSANHSFSTFWDFMRFYRTEAIACIIGSQTRRNYIHHFAHDPIQMESVRSTKRKWQKCPICTHMVVWSWNVVWNKLCRLCAARASTRTPCGGNRSRGNVNRDEYQTIIGRIESNSYCNFRFHSHTSSVRSPCSCSAFDVICGDVGKTISDRWSVVGHCSVARGFAYWERI